MIAIILWIILGSIEKLSPGLIIFSSNKSNNSSIIVRNLSEINAHNKAGKFLFQNISSDPLKSIENWFANYEFIDAAGGLVESNGKFLFRSGKSMPTIDKCVYVKRINTLNIV